MPTRPAIALNATNPVNLVTTAQPNLADSLTYLFQNIGQTRIRIGELSAAPTIESTAYRTLAPGQERTVEIAAATPPYAWVHPADGVIGMLSISEAS